MAECQARRSSSVNSFLCVMLLFICIFSNLNLSYNRKCTKVKNCQHIKWCFNLNTLSLLIFWHFHLNTHSVPLTMSLQSWQKVQSTNKHTLPKTILNHPNLSHGLKNGTAACDRDVLSGEHCLNVITYQWHHDL